MDLVSTPLLPDGFKVPASRNEEPSKRLRRLLATQPFVFGPGVYDPFGAERSRLEVLRTDTATFASLVEARRNRREPFFLVPSAAIDLCNVPLPVRPVPP